MNGDHVHSPSAIMCHECSRRFWSNAMVEVSHILQDKHDSVEVDTHKGSNSNRVETSITPLRRSISGN